MKHFLNSTEEKYKTNLTAQEILNNYVEVSQNKITRPKQKHSRAYDIYSEFYCYEYSGLTVYDSHAEISHQPEPPRKNSAARQQLLSQRKKREILTASQHGEI